MRPVVFGPLPPDVPTMPETPVSPDASDRPAQERLWITEPQRATCLATVTEVRGDRFTLDRALFAPRSRACRHPQNHDQGTVWWDGEKRRLGSVEDQGGRVWYTLRGTVPEVGVQLQCQIDPDVRSLASRAHTALHLYLAALQKADAPPIVEDPEVKGGGNFRLTFAWPASPATLAEALQQANRWAEEGLAVQRAFSPREKIERFVTKQAFQPPDPVPGPDVLPLVKIGDVCTYPCDGTHVERTHKVGRLVVAHARGGKDGFVVVGKVE